MSIRYRKDRKKFELSVVLEGKRKRLLFDSKREALECLSSPNVDQDSITISDAIKTYYQEVSQRKSRCTRISEKRYFNLMYHFLAEEKRITRLCEVRYGHMLSLQNWLKEPRVYDDRPMKWSASTVNRAFNSIKDFYVYWVRNGEIEASPCAHLQILQAQENSRRPITPAEFVLALDKAEEWFKPAMAFTYLTASAPSSLARLTWADVDLSKGMLTLSRCKGAKGKWRRIPFPISLELEALLLSQPRPGHGFVFSNESGGPLSAEWCSKVGNRAIKAAGITGVVLYSLRHALASELTDANVSTEIIRQLMGHSNIRTTQRYSKPKTESLANALTLVRGGKCHQDATKGDEGYFEASIEIAT